MLSFFLKKRFKFYLFPYFLWVWIPFLRRQLGSLLTKFWFSLKTEAQALPWNRFFFHKDPKICFRKVGNFFPWIQNFWPNVKNSFRNFKNLLPKNGTFHAKKTALNLTFIKIRLGLTRKKVCHSGAIPKQYRIVRIDNSVSES